MALIETVSVKQRSSRTSSQSSTEAEFSTSEVSRGRVASCEYPVSLSNVISTSYKHSPNLLLPHPEFLKLLKTVGAESSQIVNGLEIYTIQQLCFYLKEYIKSRQLYDVNNVRTVYCDSDPLGIVFHVDHFTIKDVLGLISKASTPVVVEPSKGRSTGISKQDNETSCSIVTSSSDLVRRLGLKRPHEQEQVQEKRICIGKCSPERDGATVGETLELKAFPVLFSDDLSDVESIYSVQSKETALIKDSSDDLWFLKEDDTDSHDLSDIYADEYDIVSELSHGSSSEADDSDSDVFVEVTDFVVSFDGSETDFADGELSDVEDEKLSRLSGENNQTWQCLKCHHSNRSPARLCNTCLNLRTEELLQAHLSPAAADHNLLVNCRLSADLDSPGEISGSRNSDSRSEHCHTVAHSSDLHDESFVSDLSQVFSSQESGFCSGDSENLVGLTEDARNEDVNLNRKDGLSNCDTDVLNQSLVSSNVCIICLSEPKVASLIHGRSGHQACCYQCARQLKKMRKPCPVCRRPIEKVIRNYVV